MDKGNRHSRCVVISGIDGSGKSTIIDEAKRSLEAEGKAVGYIWLRMNHYLTKCMHALARVLRLSVKIRNEIGDVWQHRLYKSQAFCSVYIFTTYIDSWISRLKYEKIAKGKDIVICDRWIADILVDLATKTHRSDFLESKWPHRFMKILPGEAKMFVVVRTTEDVMGCRLENRVDPDFRFRLGIYRELCAKPYVTVIDNSGTVESSVKQLLGNL